MLVILLRLFIIAALWLPAGKGLISWLSFVLFNCFCHFPKLIVGQVWYLIVSIPDLCQLSYFEKNFYHMTSSLGVKIRHALTSANHKWFTDFQVMLLSF